MQHHRRLESRGQEWKLVIAPSLSIGGGPPPAANRLSEALEPACSARGR